MISIIISPDRMARAVRTPAAARRVTLGIDTAIDIYAIIIICVI